MSYEKWFYKEKRDPEAIAADKNKIPGLIYQIAPLAIGDPTEAKEGRRYNSGASIVDQEYLREPGEAELCQHDKMSDMPDSTRAIWESTDCLCELWINPEGKETPQLASFARRDDGIADAFPRNTKTHGDRLLEEALANNLITYQQFFETVQTLDKISRENEPEYVKRIQEQVVQIIDGNINSATLSAEDLLNIKQFADQFNLQTLANELEIEVQDLVSLERRATPGFTSPRMRLQLSVPHGNRPSATQYQAWHRLTNPIRSSFKSTPDWLPFSEINANKLEGLWAAGIIAKLKTMVDAIDPTKLQWTEDDEGNKTELVQHENLPRLLKSSQQIKEETGNDEAKTERAKLFAITEQMEDKYIVWNFLRTELLKKGIEFKKIRRCYMCDEELNTSEHICEYCGTNNMNTIPKSLACYRENMYSKLETIAPKDDPNVIATLDAVQNFIQEVYGDAETTMLTILDGTDH